MCIRDSLCGSWASSETNYCTNMQWTWKVCWCYVSRVYWFVNFCITKTSRRFYLCVKFCCLYVMLYVLVVEWSRTERLLSVTEVHILLCAVSSLCFCRSPHAERRAAMRTEQCCALQCAHETLRMCERQTDIRLCLTVSHFSTDLWSQQCWV